MLKFWVITFLNMYSYLLGLSTGDIISPNRRKAVETTYDYRLMPLTGNWSYAVEECNKAKASLVSPLDRELDDNLREFLVTQGFVDSLWLSGCVSEGVWKWKWETTNILIDWWSNSRNPDCYAIQEGYCLEARMPSETWGWDWCGVPCGTISHFVCQFEKISTVATATPTSTTVTVTSTSPTPTIITSTTPAETTVTVTSTSSTPATITSKPSETTFIVTTASPTPTMITSTTPAETTVTTMPTETTTGNSATMTNHLHLNTLFITLSPMFLFFLST